MTKIYSSVFLLVFCLNPSTAYAYLDPGTGSFFLQFILAFIFALIFSLRKYWLKLRKLFFGNKSRNKTNYDKQ